MMQDRSSHDADVYLHGHHDSVMRSHRRRTADNSAAYLLPRLRPGLDLLDVGCGSATITTDLARLVAPGRVVGLDRSADAVAEAASRARDNTTYVVGDVYALDADDDEYDVVHAHQVLQHLRDPVTALVEMRRATRAGGVVAVRDADYEAMTWWPEVPGMREWLDLYRATARAIGGEPDAGRRLLAWAHAAGFRDVTASASTWCYATPEDRGWWSQTWAERVTVSEFATQACDLGLADDAELARLADAWLAWGAEPDGWFVIVHGEVLAAA